MLIKLLKMQDFYIYIFCINAIASAVDFCQSKLPIRSLLLGNLCMRPDSTFQCSFASWQVGLGLQRALSFTWEHIFLSSSFLWSTIYQYHCLWHFFFYLWNYLNLDYLLLLFWNRMLSHMDGLFLLCQFCLPQLFQLCFQILFC